MLRHCYTFHDETNQGSSWDGLGLTLNQLLLFQVKMFSMAELYQVRGLAQLAIFDFTIVAKDAVTWPDLAPLAEAIKLAYETTTDQKKLLRKVIKDLVLENKKRLFDGPETAFAKLLEDVPAFAVDVALAFARGNASSAPPNSAIPQAGYPGTRFLCPNCDRVFNKPFRVENNFEPSWTCPSCWATRSCTVWMNWHQF